MNQPPRARRTPPRSPARARTRPPEGPGTATAGVPLRLAIGKDGLGLELAGPAELGPFLVTELVAALPRVKFPVDVSGGVARFRHRRGELARISLELPLHRLQRVMRDRMRGLVGTHLPETWVGLAPSGATLSIVARDGAAVAFDVVASSNDRELRLFVVDARGIGLPRPAVAVAIEAISALLGNHARREGSSFVVEDVAARIAKALLPDAGVRVPSAEGVQVTALSGAADAWIMHLSRGRVPLEPSARVASAAETAFLLRDCDEALVRGDLAGARALALGVLGRAPRHPEICARIADLDRVIGDRTEAALAMLAEASGGETPARAILRAELLAAMGDVGVATNAFAGAGEHDPAPLFAARSFERASELATDASGAASLLDRAVARAPTLAGARFRRLERRLELGRLDDAFADAEELEAQARGSRERYDVWRRAADAFLRAGLRTKAGALYERSLKFVPDDPLALAGLGRALVAQGKVGRGVRLLARAVDLFAPKAVADRDATVIDLARALAASLGDKPAAIARLEDVSDASPCVDEARTLEAELRLALGDVAGAAFAWARLRNFAESVGGQREGLGARAQTLAAKLVAAAHFELDVRGDPVAAQRHLKTALRLAPEDNDAGALLRRAGGLVAEREGALPMADRAALPASQPVMLPALSAAPAAASEPVAATKLSVPALSLDEDDDGSDGASLQTYSESPPSLRSRAHEAIAFDFDEPQGDAVLEAKAEELTRKLQADPTDDVVADELTALLLRLGRSHEVFALVSARLDEATPERQPALRDKQQSIIRQLATEARARGNDAEASLFESFLTTGAW